MTNKTALPMQLHTYIYLDLNHYKSLFHLLPRLSEKKVDDKLKSMKKAELAAVKEGKKKPFFLKKSERKKLSLAEKFKELKQNGKLEKYMEKKRKRNAAKLKKALPSALEG